ncbi:hypothetical protein [Brevundimonas sp.]|uniref:hypothetical protein n=1 Tax=Brevundimonas sp. TaxID=1871086 RepID=UPI001AD39DA8|nr:hypothetical protein [Brevundimonas sp.]MBN9464780.1 hypothetical protein [Brevundimonas sp.]
MRHATMIAIAMLAGACSPPPAPETPPKSSVQPKLCMGSSEKRCVVYDSGVFSSGPDADDAVLVYQLQGTGPADPKDRAGFCYDGYCAVAVIRQTKDGKRHLLAHAESQNAQWYSPPFQTRDLTVFESNTLGSGNYNDDIVFRQSSDGRYSRVDVQSWKAEVTGLTLAPNSYFDWHTDYRAMVGGISLLSGAPDEWHRDPKGGCARVFLMLKGDALTVAAPAVQIPGPSC